MDAVRKFKLDTFSNQYYQFLDEFVETNFEDNKVLGKFYTNYVVAENMMDELIENIHILKTVNELRIIDPFCGDGRLITILLKKLKDLNEFDKLSYDIVVWDIDERAVEIAKREILSCAEELSFLVKVHAMKIDAFVAYIDEEAKFDICVTNPPWGLLKPQKIFNNRCTETELNNYKQSISLYDDYMKNEFYISQRTSKFGRWGTNLGRCGLEVALRLITESGLCGFVSPASLFNDQVSVSLRKWLFESYKIYNIAYFPAELKLYGTADVSSITTVVGKGITNYEIGIKLYDGNFSYCKKTMTKVAYDYIKRNQYSIPLESGFDTISILRHLEELPTVREYCERHKLIFVRELDETRVDEKLSDTGRVLFAKGYMVDRFTFNPDGRFLNEEIVSPPETVNFSKLVWRDVSRNSQKRRVKATLLPPLCIAGNSLGAIATLKQNYDSLKILLAIMNSMVFEFQARSLLVSNHVSSGVIKQIRIPHIDVDEYLLKLVDMQLNGEETEWQLEAYVAKLYGITEKQFREIISLFDYADCEKEAIDTAIKIIELGK